MLRRIYHGSKDIIEKPIYGYGKVYNDYGVGFYCTDSIDMAKEWSVDKNRDGYANIYDLDVNHLSVLDLSDSSYCILHWLAVLLQNRTFDVSSVLATEAKNYILDNFLVDYSNVDIMTGYRADDSYFAFAQDFINGTISYQQVSRAMYLGKLGKQIVLKSKRTFEQLNFVGCEIAKSSDWYTKKQYRDTTARREYLDTERNKRQHGDLYITQILDEEMKENDSRLR